MRALVPFSMPSNVSADTRTATASPRPTQTSKKSRNLEPSPSFKIKRCEIS